MSRRLQKTHRSKCSECLLLGLNETRVKTILPLIYQLIDESLLAADHVSVRCYFSSPLSLTGFWWTCSCVSFSRCLQALVHRCGFNAARAESEWCILLWCLAAQTVAARHLSSCSWLWLSSAPRVHKSTELLRHKTPDFTPDMWLPSRPDLSPVDYRIDSHQGCVYQKQQGRRTSSMSCGVNW